jgi:hypothetical protein
MKPELLNVFYAFEGKLVGTKRMQQYVCETLALMPAEIITSITKNCWFLSSIDDAWAFTFTGNDLKDQHLIFLSDDLLHQSPSQIRHSIAHEIGHVMLGHKNSVLKRQTAPEVRNQEKEADGFVRQFIPQEV